MSGCYKPRRIEFRGQRAYPGGWRLKVYSIHDESARIPGITVIEGGAPGGGSRLDLAKYEADLCAGGLIDRTLPRPATEGGRCGAGFVIVHPGRELEYLVLAWWARENELPIRLWVREYSAGAAWRPARGEEANCVWDIQVIAFERDAFVETVYCERSRGDVEGYLKRVMS